MVSWAGGKNCLSLRSLKHIEKSKRCMTTETQSPPGLLAEANHHTTDKSRQPRAVPPRMPTAPVQPVRQGTQVYVSPVHVLLLRMHRAWLWSAGEAAFCMHLPAFRELFIWEARALGCRARASACTGGLSRQRLLRLRWKPRVDLHEAGVQVV